VALKEKMKFLWGDDLKINSVHVADVCRALWSAASSFPAGSLYNLADQTDLDQGKLNDVIEKIFKIKTGFHGMIMSNLAQVSFSSSSFSLLFLAHARSS
jgi:nucleoside-diphosphate-sugar epimerase